MDPFEIPSIFPLEASPAERELGFVLTQISLAGFGGAQGDTLIRLVARRLPDTDIAIKMIHEGQPRYRLMRHGYRKFLGFRLPWVKARWLPMTVDLADDPAMDGSGVVTDIVPVPNVS